MTNTFDQQLITARLRLRRLKSTDAPAMFEYTSNPECCRYLSWHPHSQIEQTQKFVDNMINRYELATEYSWAIEIMSEEKFIGIVRLFDISETNRRAELSYILNPAFQGKGFMAEAIYAVMDYCFNTAGINRLQARCTPDNTGSESIMKRMGMSYEGKLKQYWLIKGAYADAVIYAITAGEFHKRVGSMQVSR